MIFLSSVVGICVGEFRAFAADMPPPEPNPPPPVIYDGPTFSFTGYLWASALNGKASTLPPLPAAKIDLTFADILKDLNGAVMGSGEMRLGRWGFLTDVMYSKVTSSGKLPGPYFSELEVRSESLILQGNVMYRVFTNDTVDFDLGAGARYWDLDTKLTIKPGILNTRIDRSETENWIDPVVGMRATTRFNDVWSLTLAGDIGGFDVGSRLTYQVLGSINYKWSENVMLRAGYRLLSVDYKNNDFLYDVRMHGPIFAFTYKF